jgi:DNA-binding response OmpR family regulator
MDCAVKAIDAVVTDIDLGSAPNGWIVALAARELWPTCRILYLTGVGTDARSLQGVSSGVFLSKPFDVARVADVLTALFAA